MHLPALHVKFLSISSTSCQAPSIQGFRVCEMRAPLLLGAKGGKQVPPFCQQRELLIQNVPTEQCRNRGRLLQQARFRLLNYRNCSLPACCGSADSGHIFERVWGVWDAGKCLLWVAITGAEPRTRREMHSYCDQTVSSVWHWAWSAGLALEMALEK